MSVHARLSTDTPALVDLGEVLLRVAASAKAVARARQVLVHVEVESGPLLVPGSTGAAHDTVLDVVGQVVSTCAPGAHIHLDVYAEDGGVAVTVTDTGPDEPTAVVDVWPARRDVAAVGGRLEQTVVDGVGSVVQLWWPQHVPAVQRARHLSAV